MRRQRLVVLFCFTLAVLFVPVADAQLSGDYADWVEGPERFLLTKKEKKEWAKISTDAAAEHFIALFWAKRNPEPNNPFNAFGAEFEAKVRFADQNFGFGKIRGALSARGQVLILMGRPDRRQVRGIDGPPSVDIGSGDTGDVENNTETWYYDPTKLPAGFKAKGDAWPRSCDSSPLRLGSLGRPHWGQARSLSKPPTAPAAARVSRSAQATAVRT